MKSPTAAALLALAALVGSAAQAAPITLPGGHYYFTLDVAGQTSASNQIVGAHEGAWGIALVTQIDHGTVVGQTIVPSGTPFFADGQNGGNQITGMFYGISLACGGTTGTGGFLDLYWQDIGGASVTAEAASSAGLGHRTAFASYTGFTQGQLLLHAAFLPGCDAVDPTATICLSSGQAEGYLDVLGGLWAGQMDSNFFALPFGKRDIRSVMPVSHNAAWDVVGTDIVGFTGSDGAGDPITGLAIPEPASPVLLAIALFGLAIGRRARASR